MMDRIDIKVHREPWRVGEFSLYIISQRWFDTKPVRALAELTFKEIEEDCYVPLIPSVNITSSDAQALMDQLWNLGVRPTEGHGSAGQYKAMEEHISDLRKILKI